MDKILEAARIAPTAANAQSQRLLVISSQEAKEKLSKGVNYHGAPLAIIVCGDHSDVFVRPFDKKDMVSVDATIVADHIVLEAEDLGLSSCWLTYFDPEIIRNEFNIPSNLEPIAIIAVGYADTEKASPDRHSKDREVKQREQSREHSSLKERLEENKRIVAERERENARRRNHDRGMSR